MTISKTNTHSKTSWFTEEAAVRAWLVSLLQLLLQAYECGELVCHNSQNPTAQTSFLPDIFCRIEPTDMPENPPEKTDPESISIQTKQINQYLAVNVFASTMTDMPDQRKKDLRLRYAYQGIQEYWQIELAEDDTFLASFYQLDLQNQYVAVQPDANGIYFCPLLEELAFPVHWLDSRPALLDMMQYWGLVSGET